MEKIWESRYSPKAYAFKYGDRYVGLIVTSSWSLQNREAISKNMGSLTLGQEFQCDEVYTLCHNGACYIWTEETGSVQIQEQNIIDFFGDAINEVLTFI